MTQKKEAEKIEKKKANLQKVEVEISEAEQKAASNSPKDGKKSAHDTTPYSKKKKRGTVHKDYRPIKIVLTSGEEYEVNSTYRNDSIKLDIDINTHPAWTGGKRSSGAQVSEIEKFKKRYPNLKFTLGDKKVEDEKPQ